MLDQKRLPRGSKRIETGEIWYTLVVPGCQMLDLSSNALVTPARLALTSSASLSVHIV